MLVQKKTVVLILLLMPAIVSAQSASDIANQHKITFDTYVGTIDTLDYAGTTYHVIRYNNVFPHASGIEIFTADGFRVTNPDIAKSVLTQTAWNKAATQLRPHDIETLRDIRDTSQEIHDAIAPVASATSSVTDKINELKCPYFFGQSAIDIVKTTYPGISTLEIELKILEDDLNEWAAGSTRVNNRLPVVIHGLDDLKAGKELNPELQSNIQELLSALETLKTKTDDYGSSLSDVSSTLSDAERSLNTASKSTFDRRISISPFSNDISRLADAVGDLNNRVKSLGWIVPSISSSLSEQSSKLSNVERTANNKAKKLYNSWSSRRNALVMVYSTFGAIIAIVLAIIFGVLIYTVGSKKVGVERAEVKIEEKIKEETTKISDTDGIPRRITGVIIVIVGLFLLLYSFLTAYNLFNWEFTVDETFIVRIIFFVGMIGIGSYMTEKGASISEDSRIIGIILAPIGLFMLCFSFIIANTFVNGEYIFDELFFVKIVFFFCMIGIGIYLMGKGVTLTAYPKITGLVLTAIGAFMLLFSFMSANAFVSGEFMADETFIIRIIYFVCMVGIGGYLTGKGVSEIYNSQRGFSSP